MVRTVAGNVTGAPTRRGRKAMASALPAGEQQLVVHDVGRREHELRLSGMSWAAIARECGHARAQAAHDTRERYLQRAALEMSRSSRAQALAEEVDRLDALQAPYWQPALDGDVKSAELVLKVILARAKLLGLGEFDGSVAVARTVVVTGDSEQYVATLKQLISGDAVDAEVVEDL